MRGDAGLGTEKPVEMRPREAGGAGDRVQFDLGAGALRHQLDGFANAKIGDGGGRARLLHCLRLLPPAFLVADINQLPEFAIEAPERGSAADQCRGAVNLFVERIRAPEMRAGEAQMLRVCRGRRKPFGIYIKHEEDRAIGNVRRQEVVRFPWIDRDDGVRGELPALITHVDLRRRSADVKDQVPLAVRMHVEGTVQLIDRRATELAVEDGKRSAHALPPAGCFFLATNVQHPKRECKGEHISFCNRAGQTMAGSHLQKIGQYFLHSGMVRLGKPILENTAGS